ncbi:unnamed protein product [Auanema sp. JU1783]|nr:unnamed protein product [Auanema sp. JU1783]
MPFIGCFSSGPVSPQPLKERVIDIQTVPARAPSPPARRHFLSTGNLNIPNIDEPTSSSLADNCYDDYDNHSYSSSDTRRPARTLILPSSVPGRSIEIPLGSSNYDSVPPPLPREHSISKERKPDSSAASQLEKLSQRLKKLAQPFKHSSNHHDDYIKTASMPNLLQKEKRVESPTNSSGIGADIMDTTDSSNSSEEQKRTSDLSSLSDQNSLLSDIAADDTRNSTVNNLKQPYLNRLAREKSPSTSVLQTVLDQIGRENKPKIPILSTFAGSRNSDPLSGILIDEDIYRSTMPKWARPQNEPVVNPLNDSKLYNNSDMESEIQNRKRVICNKMADALKLIENGVEQIKKATAAQRWRGAHILQANLNSLQNAVSTINESLDSFVVSSGRISVENGSPKSAELQRLLAPLLQSRSQIASLRKSLDSTGWTVAALSRGKDHINTMDPLEQFISLSQEIPTACRSLLQWVQLLVPSNTVVFLSPSAIVSNSALTALTSMSQNPAYNTRTEDLKNPNFLKMEERLKGSVPNIHEIKTIPITHALSSIDILSDQIPSVPSMNILPSSLPSSVKSASSSSNSSTSEYATIGPKKQNANPLKDARILEEDDLESVYSDRESLLQDYAYLDDAVAGRTNNSTSPFINEEDRQLVRFYAPQIKQHIDALGDAIEAFLAAVENSLPPREFVQKGKLIILTVHKLIYIGDTISQCVKDKVINENMRTCADRLCELLKQCVRATKIAADEYPDIRCMQTMVDSIINVSKSAHDLKAMANNYC